MATKKVVKKEVEVKNTPEKVLKVQPLVGGGMYARTEDLYAKLNEVINVING